MWYDDEEGTHGRALAVHDSSVVTKDEIRKEGGQEWQLTSKAMKTIRDTHELRGFPTRPYVDLLRKDPWVLVSDIFTTVKPRHPWS